MSSNDLDKLSIQDLKNEIERLRERVDEIERLREKSEDDDDIMNDPDVHDIVDNGDHICHMFDGECIACEEDED